jgi:DNA-binding transcriptional LysR family regulator
MRYAIAVAKTGSISKAARHLLVSPPSILSAVNELEAKLNIKIFDRSHNGVRTTEIGSEFISNAMQAVMQVDMITERFTDGRDIEKQFSVSTQHYTFASAAFAKFTQQYKDQAYRVEFLETKTSEVISNVRNLISEIGLLYISDDNSTFMNKILHDNDLIFTEIYKTPPYVLLGGHHPLSKKHGILVDELMEYPSIAFGQEDLAPLYFSEEILLKSRQNIVIRDRGALADLLHDTDAYLVCSGVYMTASKHDTTAAVPLLIDKEIHIGIVRHKYILETEDSIEFCRLMSLALTSHR